MNWIEKIYKETDQRWKDAGSDPKGYAIFYSPVLQNARIVIIGYNPGGGSDDFSEATVPEMHEYVLETYPLAQKMRKIFHAAGIKIEETVKFNLIFFRSQKANDIQNRDLIQFSEEKVLDILENLQPKIIITEGFKTFDRLLKLIGAQKLETIRSKAKDRAILVIAETKDKLKVLGMIHPTGGRGILEEEFLELGQHLKNHVQ